MFKGLLLITFAASFKVLLILVDARAFLCRMQREETIELFCQTMKAAVHAGASGEQSVTHPKTKEYHVHEEINNKFEIFLAAGKRLTKNQKHEQKRVIELYLKYLCCHPKPLSTNHLLNRLLCQILQYI